MRTGLFGADSLNHRMNTKMPNQLDRTSFCGLTNPSLPTSFAGQLHPSRLAAAALEAKATFEFSTRPKRATCNGGKVLFSGQVRAAFVKLPVKSFKGLPRSISPSVGPDDRRIWPQCRAHPIAPTVVDKSHPTNQPARNVNSTRPW